MTRCWVGYRSSAKAHGKSFGNICVLHVWHFTPNGSFTKDDSVIDGRRAAPPAGRSSLRPRADDGGVCEHTEHSFGRVFPSHFHEAFKARTEKQKQHGDKKTCEGRASGPNTRKDRKGDTKSTKLKNRNVLQECQDAGADLSNHP